MWAILGPTASGKSETALIVATRLGGEVVSVDSMQVYRGMDIGTAKPSPEQRARVPHHLIDIVEPEVSFSVSDFQAAGREVMQQLAPDPTLIVGGSGLHFRALIDPLQFPATDESVRRRLEELDPGEARRRLLEADPGAAALVDLANPRRVVRALEVLELTGSTPSGRAATAEAESLRRYEALVPVIAVGFDPGDRLAERVEARIDAMLDRGLLDEVARLRRRLGPTARQALGYKELAAVVHGAVSLEQGRADMIRATLALAKRQRTYFRRDPRVRWLPWDDDATRRATAAADAFKEAAAWTS